MRKRDLEEAKPIDAVMTKIKLITVLHMSGMQQSERTVASAAGILIRDAMVKRDFSSQHIPKYGEDGLPIAVQYEVQGTFISKQNQVASSVMLSTGKWKELEEFGFINVSTRRMDSAGTIMITWDESYAFPNDKITFIHDTKILSSIVLHHNGMVKTRFRGSLIGNFDPFTVQGLEEGLQLGLDYIKNQMRILTEQCIFFTGSNRRHEARGRMTAKKYGF